MLAGFLNTLSLRSATHHVDCSSLSINLTFHLSPYSYTDEALVPPCVQLVVVMLGMSAPEQIQTSTDIASLSLSLSLSPDVIPALVQPPSDKTSLKVSGHHHYVR